MAFPNFPSRLGEFSTVDWHHDNLVNQRYRGLEHQRVTQNYSVLRQFFSSVIHVAEPWILVALIGFLTAVTASYIEIGTEFLADMRIGYCDGLSLLNQRYCCGSELSMDYKNDRCIPSSSMLKPGHLHEMGWHSWSYLLNLSPNSPASTFVNLVVFVCISVAFALMAALMVRHFAPFAAGSGIPEVKTILGGFVMSGVLGFSTFCIKCLGLCMSVASGLAVGKEGPLVQVACCWASIVSGFSLNYRHNEGKKRELISAAAAAGVSVAFGAPIGGVLFSLEEVSSYFPPKTLWYSFFSAVIAALSYKSLDTRKSEQVSMFQLDSLTLVGSWEVVELIPFAFLGLMGGILGAVFIHLNVRWNAIRRKYNIFRRNPVWEVVIITVLTSAVNFNFPLLKTLSSNLMESLFSRCGASNVADMFDFCANSNDKPIYSYSSYRISSSIIKNLSFALILKFLQAAFTFGIGVPAGLFIPSLAVGAVYGRLMGLFMIQLNERLGFMSCYKCIHPGIYALVGAASMLGGVTRMTISLVVILLELSGGLTYVVPFMIVILISKWVGDAICEQGIYDCHIILKGYPYLHENISEDATFAIQAKDIMEKEIVVISSYGNTIGSLDRKLAWYKFSGFPLVNSSSSKLMLGYIQSHDLQECLKKCLEFDGVSASTPVVFQKAQTCEDSAHSVTQSKDKSLLSSGHSYKEYFMQFSVRGAIVRITMTENKRAKLASVINLEEIVVRNPIELLPETPISQIWSVFRLLGLRICFFTKRGVLKGLLTKKSLLSHRNFRIGN